MKQVIVTEVESGNHFWAQDVEQGKSLKTTDQQLSNDNT